MRYVFRFWFAFALGLALMAGCTEENGEGGSGGTAGTGGSAGTGGLGGTGGVGGTGGMPECETTEDCDDGNECTRDVCNLTSGSCGSAPVPDETECGGKTPWGDPRGACYGGLCNFVPVSVAVGEREVVFDWSAARCEDLDIPDGPARAVRAQDGEVVLFATHYSGNYLSRGASFDALRRVCDPPPLVSAELPTPDSYENFEWLWSPYREGGSWHVLMHNEHHPPGPLPCTAAKNCTYNSITYAVSTDDARTFAKPSPPTHTVAPAPDLWTPPGPETPPQPQYVEGYFEPSNIILGPDGYYYALFWTHRHYEDTSLTAGRECIMRTKTLGDPASWRAWDGEGFNLPMLRPYASGSEVEPCRETPSPVVRWRPLSNTWSLTYNTYLERYMWVGEESIWGDDGELVCGVYFSTSLDLLHWSEVQLIAEAILWCDPPTSNGLEPVRIQYPSIIDHEDSTTNFERPGRTPYLYYTRHNGGLDRDLVRVPLTFALEE